MNNLETYRPASQAEMHAQPPLTPPDPPHPVDWDDIPAADKVKILEADLAQARNTNDFLRSELDKVRSMKQFKLCYE